MTSRSPWPSVNAIDEPPPRVLLCALERRLARLALPVGEQDPFQGLNAARRLGFPHPHRRAPHGRQLPAPVAGPLRGAKLHGHSADRQPRRARRLPGPRPQLVGEVRDGRRLPRLIDSLHLVAEHERRKAERDALKPSPSGRDWRPRFAEVVAVLALIAAIAAWWH